MFLTNCPRSEKTYSILWTACGGVVVERVDKRAVVVAHFCWDGAGRTKSGVCSDRPDRWPTRNYTLQAATHYATLDSCLFCATGWYGGHDRSPAPPRGSVSNLISSKTHLRRWTVADTISRANVGKSKQGDSPNILDPIFFIPSKINVCKFWCFKFLK